MASWGITVIDAKILQCMERSQRYTSWRILHCLNRQSTVSWCDRTQFIMACSSFGMARIFEHLTWKGALPMYPRSALTCSNGSRNVAREERKMLRSFQIPGVYGSLIQQMSHVRMQRATSYLKTIFLNLKE